MFEVDKMSSFFTKLSKDNMGASDVPCDGGHLTPHDTPMLFFSKNKNLFNQMAVFFQEQN